MYAISGFYSVSNHKCVYVVPESLYWEGVRWAVYIELEGWRVYRRVQQTITEGENPLSAFPELLVGLQKSLFHHTVAFYIYTPE